MVHASRLEARWEKVELKNSYIMQDGRTGPALPCEQDGRCCTRPGHPRPPERGLDAARCTKQGASDTLLGERTDSGFHGR
jgi:hypothetical protein